MKSYMKNSVGWEKNEALSSIPYLICKYNDLNMITEKRKISKLETLPRMGALFSFRQNEKSRSHTLKQSLCNVCNFRGISGYFILWKPMIYITIQQPTLFILIALSCSKLFFLEVQ
jgi:hypothetical protein